MRALSAEPFSTASAYQLGGELVAAHFTGPEISGRLVKVLGTRLLPDVGLDREPYRSRLAALLGAATTGYARALRDRALDDQETIVRASMIARTEAERALRDSEERRWHEARHDPLTGLPNRLGFAEQLAEQLAGAGPGDTDRALPAGPGPVPRAERHARARTRPTGCWPTVAVRLSEHAGGRLLARLGGDEFALLVPGGGDLRPGRDRAAGRAGRGAAAGRADAADRDRQRRAGRAAGPPGSAVDELLRSADIALTWAKSDGRNRWRRFDPDRNARRHGPLEPGRGAAGRGPGRRAGGALPADGRAGRRPAARGRGAGALAAPAARGCCCRAGSSPPPRRPGWSCRWAGRCSRPPAPRPRPGPR